MHAETLPFLLFARMRGVLVPDDAELDGELHSRGDAVWCGKANGYPMAACAAADGGSWQFWQPNGPARGLNERIRLRGLCDAIGLEAVPPGLEADDGPQPAFDAFGDEWPEPSDLFASASATPFPLDVLPAAVADYCADQADRMGVDAGMLGMLGLGICASALTDEIRIQPKRNDPTWTEAARLWVAIVGDPSIRKTPAWRAMAAPLYRQDERWRQDEARELAEYRAAQAAAKKDDEPAPVTLPVIHRALVEDITVEALSDVLQYTPRGTLVHHDELSSFFGGMDAYRARGVSKDRGYYLRLFNGDGHRVDRRSGSLFVANWGASIVGGIQPDMLRRVAGGFVDDGLLQRFNLYLARPATEGHDRDRNRALFDRYSDTVAQLFATGGSGARIHYGDEAAEIARRMDRLALDLGQVDALPMALRTHVGKWGAMFARVALTLHAVECAASHCYPGDYLIDGTTAAKAERLFKACLLPHALAFYQDVGKRDTGMERARWLAGFVLSRRLDTLDRRTIRMSYRDLRDAESTEIANVLQLLDLFGWARPADESAVPKRWDINPRVHVLFAEKAAQERQQRARVREILNGAFANDAAA